MRPVKRRFWRNTLVAAVVLAALAPWAYALINPGFTPVHMHEESELIFTFKFGAADADGSGATLVPLEAIKGQLPAGKLRVDLKAIRAERDGAFEADTFLDLLKGAGERPGVIAAGTMRESKQSFAFLHLEGRWAALARGEGGGAWSLKTVNHKVSGMAMDATFNGGSDMLIEALRFIGRYPGVKVMPVDPGARWVEHVRLGKLLAKATLLQAVDADADGRLDVFAACHEGDRLFLQKEKGKFTELSGAPGSSSATAAWADFDGDGRPDLASLPKDSRRLRLWLQKMPGIFTAIDLELPAKVEAASPTVFVVDIELDGRPDLVVGCGAKWPVVLGNDGRGRFRIVSLPEFANGTGGPDLGPSGPCVVADFDGDGFADIVQTFQKGGVFWRGKAGGFEPPAECGAACGKAERRRAHLADLEGDGLIDIFLIGGRATSHLLRNLGGGRFAEVFRYCGEPNYKIQTDTSCAAFGDFNNDSFVDLFAGGEGEERMFFFNRGFRSLAVDERQMLKIDEESVPRIEEGVVAAVWADFGGTGALSLASALPSGEVWLSRTDLAAQPRALALRVPAEVAGKSAAPAVVRFFLEERALGARIADRWCGPAVMGVDAPGVYTAAWRGSDGREVRRKIEAGGDAPARAAAPEPKSTRVGPAPAMETVAPAPPPGGGLPLGYLAGGAGLAVFLVIVGLVAFRRKPERKSVW